MQRTGPCRVLAVLLVRWVCVSAQGDIGDPCVLAITGEKGICRLSRDCPIVEEQAKRGISPTICQFYQLTTPIVCCEYDRINLPQPNEGLLTIDNEPITFPDEKEQSLPEREQEITAYSKAEQKCLEYSRTVTGTVQAIPLVTNTEPISINIEKCDYNSVALIVGGTPAAAGEFPFMAALGIYEDGTLEWRCGGTLISDRYVLTAAHCAVTRDENVLSLIRLGDSDLTKTDDGSQHKDYDVDVGNIIVHPEYKYPLKYNDIALVPSKRKITFSKFIRPACLHTNGFIEQKTAVATGWGKTDYASDNSDRLMKVSLNIYENKQCAKTYGINKNWPEGIGSNMLCAGELKGGKDTCQGDSGGPLIVTKKGNQCKFYVVGITSFGKSCGQINTPAVYTRVSEYVSWIEQTIW